MIVDFFYQLSLITMANFQSQPPAGQQLPANWKEQAERNRREFDEIYRQRIENQWRQPHKDHGIMQAARLRTVNYDRADSASSVKPLDRKDSVRMDENGMVLVSTQDSWEIWQDSFTKATIWKRK